jgi:hypothetical protein
MVGPTDLESLCSEDPFGEEGSDFELWPPADPDDYEFLTSTDLLV